MNLDEIREEIDKLSSEEKTELVSSLLFAGQKETMLSEEEQKELIQIRDDALSGKTPTYSREVINNDIRKIISKVS